MKTEKEIHMKSVKPGRGPSMMGAIGSLGATLFGIIWTILAFSISPFFALFGVVFVVIGISQFIYNLHNVKAKDRFSVVDITDSIEENDPLNERFGKQADHEKRIASAYCPYCGEGLKDDYLYCPKCGKKLN